MRTNTIAAVLLLASTGCYLTDNPRLDASETDGEDGATAGEEASTGTSESTTGNDDSTGTSGETCCLAPEPPKDFQLSFSPIKQFEFSWTPVDRADYYHLLEIPALGEQHEQLGEAIDGDEDHASFTMPLHLRTRASYVLSACNDGGCTDSAPIPVTEALDEAIGYIKAPNAEANDRFGHSVALSDDGQTLVVGAPFEDSNNSGFYRQANNSATNAGAAYVFVQDESGHWVQQDYLEASNTDDGDGFGFDVALSGDGNTLAIGAPYAEVDSNPYGDKKSAGAVYVFVRKGNQWTEQRDLKTYSPDDGDEFGHSLALSDDGDILAIGAPHDSNKLEETAHGVVYVFTRDGERWPLDRAIEGDTRDEGNASGQGDEFGSSIALSDDGRTLAVGARSKDSDNATDAGAVYVFRRSDAGEWSRNDFPLEASNVGATDHFGESIALNHHGNVLAVGAPGEDDSPEDSGAVYLFMRDEATWSQQAYIKASNADHEDRFGHSVDLSDDGQTLAIGAIQEDSGATGLYGDSDNDSNNTGAVYVFERNGTKWPQQAYVKAPNTDEDDQFGFALALSGDGDTLAVGTDGEDGSEAESGGDQADNSAEDARAVYLY